MNENTNITIIGNGIINKGNKEPNTQDRQTERRPLDRSNEILISNDTSFDGLLEILRNKPEAIAASRIEAEEKNRETEEERRRMSCEEEFDFVSCRTGQENGRPEKAGRRSGACYLRLYEPMVAKIEFPSGGFCEVFANGYAVYDNGNRKCVVWVPDCRTVTYYFGPLKENEKEYLDGTKELGTDELGPLPWYHALVLSGEDRIEYNMEHPKSKGSVSDTENPEEWELKQNFRWSCGTHFENPEEFLIKKEEAKERRMLLTERQRKAYVMYFEEERTQEEIAAVLGISQPAVKKLLDKSIRRIREHEEKI